MDDPTSSSMGEKILLVQSIDLRTTEEYDQRVYATASSARTLSTAADQTWLLAGSVFCKARRSGSPRRSPSTDLRAGSFDAAGARVRSRLAAWLSISGGIEDESALAKRPAITSAADAGPALFSLLGTGSSES
jgi:hypothetical protein